MKTRIALGIWILALAVSVGISGPQLGHAQEDSSLGAEASRMDAMASSHGEAAVTDKISSNFESFLGSDPKDVVTGLRNGTPITLTETTPSTTPGQPPTTTTTTIPPPTGKMGHGEVFITLSLAKHQLNQAGIMEPTPSQLQAALTGGSVTNGAGTTTNLQGILAMRSENMGWGQIAKSMGVNLGSVVSGQKASSQGIGSRAASPSGTSESGIVNAGGKPAGSTESGIVTGGGKALGRSSTGKPGKGIVTGLGRPAGAGPGSRIVTGAGRSAGPSWGTGRSQGKRGLAKRRGK